MIWPDAAGVSRKIAFVAYVWSSSGPHWYWSCLPLPRDIWDLLTDRHDEQMQFQEFVGIPIAYSSLALRGHLVHQWIDNDSVLWSMLKGSSRLPEVNAGVARSWTDFRKQQIGWHGSRVTSAANIADGPTRDDLRLVERLGAVFVQPILPEWLRSLWQIP